MRGSGGAQHGRDMPANSTRTQIVIIGTLHGRHSESAHYSVNVLKRILEDLRPAAILVELPRAWVGENGRVAPDLRKGSNCPEVAATDEVAAKLGVRQIAFDRPDRQENFQNTRYFERLERTDNLIEELGRVLRRDDPTSTDLKTLSMLEYAAEAQEEMSLRCGPDVVNSRAFDQLIRLKHALWYDVVPSVVERHRGYEGVAEALRFFGAEWVERNAIMAENIVQAAADFRGKRLVVTTGCEHRYVLRDCLASRESVELTEFWEIL